MSLLQLIPNYQALPPFLKRGDTVVISLRDSGGDSQDESTEQQQKLISAWCEYHNLLIARVYEDKAISGSRTDRPSYEQMRVDLIEKRVNTNVALFWRLDRQGRNYNYDMAVYFEFQHHGIHMHGIADSIAGDGWVRDLEVMLQKRADESYIKKMSEDIKRGMHSSLSAGYWIGNPPTGYRTIDVPVKNDRTGKIENKKRLEIDPIVGPAVTRCFELAASGMRYADIWSETGRVICAEKHRITRISQIIRNRTYLGEYKRGGILYGDLVPPLTDAHTFSRVQGRLRKHKSRSGIKYLLAGVLYCECGGKMYGARHYWKKNSKERDYHRYRCSNSHPSINTCTRSGVCGGVTVESSVVDQIKATVLSKTWLEALYEKSVQSHGGNDIASQINALRVALSIVDTKTANLGQAIASVGFSKVLQEQLLDLQSERNSLSKQIEDLTAQSAASNHVDSKDLDAVRLRVETALSNGKISIVNDVLRAVIERVTVYDDALQITYKITPDFFLE